MGNFAYIDNQNLFMSTHKAKDPWEIDMQRLRVYLKEKYHVDKAYLFMGAFDYGLQDMYENFQSYDYILIWREHGLELKAKKKGNVDVDIVFQIMRDVHTNKDMDKVVLISGDGDYFRTISYVFELGKLEKVLLPSHKNASSLYKRLPEKVKAYIDTPAVKEKIKRRLRLGISPFTSPPS